MNEFLYPATTHWISQAQKVHGTCHVLHAWWPNLLEDTEKTLHGKVMLKRDKAID